MLAQVQMSIISFVPTISNKGNISNGFSMAADVVFDRVKCSDQMISAPPFGS